MEIVLNYCDNCESHQEHKGQPNEGCDRLLTCLVCGYQNLED